MATAKKAPATKAAAKKAPATKAPAKKAAGKAPAKKTTMPTKTAPPPAAKKAAAKSPAKKAGAQREPNAAFMKQLTPSPTLAAVIGAQPLPRTEVTKKMWEYIKKHGLQDASKRTMINADEKLKPIFGADQVSMFEMTRLVNGHLG